MWAAQYITPPGVFQVWSAPEMPHSDGILGLGFSYQIPCEKAASSVDNSPLQSPRISSHKPASETLLARRDSNAHATVHPLPLPPGAALSSSQAGPISPVRCRSDFSGASLPSQSTPISSLTVKPELRGDNITSQPAPISPVGSKPELMPIKSQWQKGKLIGRGTFGSVYVASNRYAWLNVIYQPAKSHALMLTLFFSIERLEHYVP